MVALLLEGRLINVHTLGCFFTPPQFVILRDCDFIDLSWETLDLKQNRHPESL